MKKFLSILPLSIIILFGFSSEIFAQDIVRYSEYSYDWTLDKQLFNLGDVNIDFNTYKAKIFKVAILSGVKCGDDEVAGDVAEFGENFQGLGRLEVIGNNANEITFWKFKPGKAFDELNSEDFIEFCYGEEGAILDSKIKIKKSEKQLTLKTVGTGDQKKVVITKEIGDNGTDVEVSLRCEPDDISFSSINTGEEEEMFVISLKKLDLKTNNDEFKVRIEGDGIEDNIDTVDTFFNVRSDSINALFYFSPDNNESLDSGAEGVSDESDFSENEDSGVSTLDGSDSTLDNHLRSSKYLSQYPDFLEMSLYRGTISKFEDIFDTEKHELIAKSNGISLSTNLIVEPNMGNTYSLVTHIKGSSATSTIKVYSISRDGIYTYQDDYKIDVTVKGEKIAENSLSTFFNTKEDNADILIKFNPDDTSTGSDADFILKNKNELQLSLYTGSIIDISGRNAISSVDGLILQTSLDLSVNSVVTLVAIVGDNEDSAVYKTYSFSQEIYGAKLYTEDFKLSFTDGDNQVEKSLGTKFLIEGNNITPEFVFSPESFEEGSNAKYIIDHPEYVTMKLFLGSDTTGIAKKTSTGLSISTNINDFTNGGIYTLEVKIGGGDNGQVLVKTYSFSQEIYGAKLYTEDFKISIEGNGGVSIKNSEDTFFSVQSDNVDVSLSFNPEDVSEGTNANFIINNPSKLKLSLYRGKIIDYNELDSDNLILKANGLNLHTNLNVETQGGNIYSFVAVTGDSYIVKVYSISKYGAKIISSVVFPSVAKSGSKVKFNVTANIFNSLSNLDYAQIVFDDTRFEKLNLKLEDGDGDFNMGGDAGTELVVENLSKELTFSGDYILPSDNNLNGQFIGYEVYVILKDGTRTKLDGKKEIYVGTRDDICKDSKMCVLRGLKALKDKDKTAFDKILIENFDENEYDFTENDLYKVFRKK